MILRQKLKSVRLLYGSVMAAIFVAACLIAGCSGNEEATATISPTSTPIPTEEPLVITDALGQTLSFESAPTKIAAISPTATEMLYLAGGTSILRDRASNFPDEVMAVPDVGSAYNPSIEMIVAERPDLVIIEALTQARFAKIFADAGLRVMAVKAETLEDIKKGISGIGILIGESDRASERISDIEDRIVGAGSDDGRSVLTLISDQDNNLYAARPESYTGLITDTVGMVNKAAGLPDSGPYPGFAMMSPEMVLMANPDIILTISPAPEPAPRLSALLTHIPPFAGLKAMQTGGVIEVDVALFLQAPGPRIVDAVEFLKQRLSKESS